MSVTPTTTSVVIGSGSAGGIVAARLSEDPNHRVILVEAGPDYAAPEDLPESLKDAFNPQLKGHDWGIEAFFTEPAQAREAVPYPRGRVVGGSSAVNGTVGIRGMIDDFEEWRELGNPSWSWDRVLTSFIELENDLDFGNDVHHSNTGPVTIFRFPESDWPQALRAEAQDLIDEGIPFCPDLNKPGATGIGPIPRNQTGELRGSSLVTHLFASRHRSNLEILGSTEAIRILFDGTRAVGVQVERNGQQEVIRADNVVVSAGAIKSPQLLQLSGVGPAGELKRLGIPVVSDLSGVGGNLQDHPCIPLLATAAQPDPEHHGFRLYGRFSSTEGTNDLAFCHGQMAVSAINFPVDTAAPDIVFFTAILGKPTSRGWVKVNSTNHLEPPEIHLNFLGTEDDVARIKQAYQVIARAVERGTLNSALAGVIVPSRDVYGDSLVDWLGTTEADAYLRQVVITSYHAAGTCAMGPDPAQGAVVDDKLRVHGTEGLYVVDASVMPTITNGMTHLSTSMIGHHFVTLFNEGRENSTESHAMAQGQ